MKQIQSLGKGVDKLLILSGILSKINLCLAVTWISIILTTLQEIRIWLVIVLIDDRHTQLFCQLPSCFIVRIVLMRTRTGCTNDDNLRMSLSNTLIDILEAFTELRRDLLFIADTQIFQVEGFWMTSISTHLCPFVCGRIAISPLNKVDSLSHPLIHFRHWHNILSLCWPHAPATIRSLTAYTCRQDRYWLHTKILTELEILKVTKTHALMVTPGVLQTLTLFLRTDSSLPTIGVPESVATTMNHTSARETHKLWI